LEASTIQETDEQRAARLEAEQEALDRGAELEADGRDLPEGAADDGEGSTVDPQSGFFDHALEDEALEKVLDEREKLRVQRAEINAKFRDRDTVAKAKIAAFDLADGEVARCGRHRIEIKPVAARSVAFDTAPTRRVNIKLFDT
jgi:hypothetical protein